MRIYYMHPVMAGPIEAWGAHLQRCQAMGFDYVCFAPLFAPGRRGDIFLTRDHETIHPALGEGVPADSAIGQLCAQCQRYSLGLIVTIVLDRIAADRRQADGTLHRLYSRTGSKQHRLDPRLPSIEA